MTEHNLEFLSLKGGCKGLSESIHVKVPYCWKYHVLAHIYFLPSQYGKFSKMLKYFTCMHSYQVRLDVHCLV